MPLYTVTTQRDLLSGDAKAELAAKLTALHCETSGVPKNWVHIVFHDYPVGSGFTAGQPAATVTLTLLIRTGRSSEYKRDLLKRLWDLLQSARRPDRDRHSGSASEPGDGDGADYAGCRRTFAAVRMTLVAADERVVRGSYRGETRVKVMLSRASYAAFHLVHRQPAPSRAC
jgi:phenylpyruvate tautomerase PptA (4-oxalocrotonate tautomerase family)